MMAEYVKANIKPPILNEEKMVGRAHPTALALKIKG
jgi:hypothetical protein